MYCNKIYSGKIRDYLCLFYNRVRSSGASYIFRPIVKIYITKIYILENPMYSVKLLEAVFVHPILIFNWMIPILEK